MKKIFLFILICSSLVYSQSSKTERINFWSDFNGSYKLDEKWKLYGDAGYRTVFIINKFQRLYIRPSASYRLSSFSNLHAGIALFTTFDKNNTLWEIRPFQGFEVNWPKIFSTNLNHYLRTEERFFRGNIVNTFLLRLRYRLGTIIQFSQIESEQYFYTPLQLEWFFNYGSDVDFQINEFRAVIGLGYVINNSWKVEFNTIFDNLSASSDLFVFKDLVLRFRVFKEFNP